MGRLYKDKVIPSIAFEPVTGYNPELPTRATSGSAGYDFCTEDYIIIYPGDICLIRTGIKARMPEGVYLHMAIRSSVGIKKRVRLTNVEGIIDSDYYNNPDNEGEIMISLYNFGDYTVTFEAGERVAQGIFQPYLRTDYDRADNVRTGATAFRTATCVEDSVVNN